jgi:hypothetical protein
MVFIASLGNSQIVETDTRFFEVLGPIGIFEIDSQFSKKILEKGTVK